LPYKFFESFHILIQEADHLGSLLTLTNTSGTVVTEHNFDAWGRNRNPANWTYSGVPANPSWLYHGYTGHEHVKEFALINMNGRMYDPVTCRMLSPDNYVPMPWNTQGYNRYGYANNNPLIYTDPDGNFFLIPILIAAGIGAVSSAANYSVTAGAGFTWRGFLNASAYGAVAGAVGGGISQFGIGIFGATANSVGLNVISNVGAQVGTGLAFGNDITFGTIAGSIAGGIASNRFGNFQGVEGGVLANIGAEIGFNVLKYGTSGIISGGLGAAFDGNDIGQGALNGLRNGALGGAATAGINIATMGASYIPEDDYGVFDSNAPLYRRGTFLTRAIFGEGSGVTLGRNLVTHLAKSNGGISNYIKNVYGVSVDYFNRSLIAHETGHYYYETLLGFGKLYGSTLSSYLKFTVRGSYFQRSTMEYAADLYAFRRLGYYFDINLRLPKGL